MTCALVFARIIVIVNVGADVGKLAWLTRHENTRQQFSTKSKGKRERNRERNMRNINERKFSRPSLVKNIQSSFHDSVVLVWPRPSNVGAKTLPHFVCVCLSTHSLQHWRGDLHKRLMHTCSMLLNIIDWGGSQIKFISKMCAAEGPDDAHYSSHMKRDPACMPSRLSSTFLY